MEIKIKINKPPFIKRPSKRVSIISAIVIVAAIGAIAALKLHDPTPYPKEVRADLEFKPPYFTDLPVDYEVLESSYTHDSGVLTYKVEASSIVLFVSMQKKPEDFNIDAFYKAFKERQSTPTPYGSATIGKTENTKVGSIVIDETWVFISEPVDQDYSRIRTLFSHLRR